MSNRKGAIKVNTSDIFPIIKKWLYSEHDIFLRELVSNSTDAITKRAAISRTSGDKMPDGSISLTVNKTKKTLTITDNGLGMTEPEVEKYIAQLAFSGAEEFVEKMKSSGEKADEIIGKFGLGFYSAFMVADKVVIDSLSREKEAEATRWICEGETEYEFASSDKKEIGTSITLYINKENEEFLDDWKVSQTLRKFCDFLPYQITVLDEEAKPVEREVDGKKEMVPVEPTKVNETLPLWKRDPKEVTEDEYKEFYRKLYPMDPDPLFWVHLKIDHPFTLEGILYFPKFNPNKPFHDNNIRMYCKQVFVSDNVKNIIPDFLVLLKGAIDSTDIPLNVSRSSLQGDPNIKKISNYIIKKVADALKVLFKKDREKYEKIWEDTGLFIKYGCVSDTKFDDLMRDKVVFKNSSANYMTLDQYRESIPEAYQEKMKGKVLYFEKNKSDFSLRGQLLEEGVETIETDDHIDPHFLQHVEMHKKGDHEYKFASVDSEIGNLLKDETTSADDVKIRDLFTKVLTGDTKEDDTDKMEIEIEKLKNGTSPGYFKVDEQMKRFSKMAVSMGNNAAFPMKKTLVINPANPIVLNALKLHEKGEHPDLVDKLCHHIEDMAHVSSEGLNNENKQDFLKNTQDLIKKLSELAI
ncbi:MAG: molecular chaperone HtpG [Bacteriovoracaceae bacterium]